MYLIWNTILQNVVLLAIGKGIHNVTEVPFLPNELSIWWREGWPVAKLHSLHIVASRSRDVAQLNLFCLFVKHVHQSVKKIPSKGFFSDDVAHCNEF